MRLNYKFTNIFGTAYKSGNLTFTHNGLGLLSPVGNQINVLDLKKDEVATIEINSFYNLRHVALSPTLPILIAVNDGGEASICSLVSGSVMSVFCFRNPISYLSFSPDGKYICVAKGHCVMVYFAPSEKRQFNHLEFYRTFYGFTDDVVFIDWSSNSKFFIAGSLDNTCRVFSLHHVSNLVVYTLSGHSNPVIAAFFFQDSLNCLTVSSDGLLISWEASMSLESSCIESPSEKVIFKLFKRYRYLSSSDVKITSPVTSAAFHKRLRMLATGFESGLLTLHTFPDFIIVCEVNLFANALNTININHNGDWICAGSEMHGQLAVWEWRSQSCYLRAESHAIEMTSLAYSPDGLHLVTGGYDAKVKVWRISGGRSIVTFSEHTAAVTGVAFPATNAKVVVSASLDGTVRAHDLVRYRNFRTLTVATRRVQFASLAVDGRGSLVAAGGLDSFEAYVWSMKTGQLLTTLTGHRAPISALAFNPDVGGLGIELATVSWDSTLRLWDVTGNSSDENNLSNMGLTKEVVNFSCDALCVVYRNDGKQLAVCLLNGNIVLYDPNGGVELGTIDGHRDLGVTQTSEDDLITSVRAAQGRKFQTISYSVDGEHLLAAGDSKYVCLYSVPDKLLLKRFEVTCNLSLDGVQEMHDRRSYLKRYSQDAKDAISLRQPSLPIPVNRKGEDLGLRQWKPEVRVSSVEFSPTGDAFAVTSTEGVLIYSLPCAGTGFGVGSSFGCSLGQSSGGWLFDTLGIDEECTPSNALAALAQGKQAEALDIAIRLQIHELVEKVMESIPVGQIDFLAKQLSVSQIAHFLVPFLARQLSGRSRHVELYAHWTDSILRSHALSLRKLAANSALSDAMNAKDQKKFANQHDEDSKSNLNNPGFLSQRGEWAACQANLIRLHASLSKVKSQLVKRCESVDNLWNYLSNLTKLNVSRSKSDENNSILDNELMDVLTSS